MKLRRLKTKQGLAVQAWVSGNWMSLNQIPDLGVFAEQFSGAVDLGTNMVAVMQLGPEGWSALQVKLENIEPQESSQTSQSDQEVCLPFEPTSFRDFMLFEKHVIDATRGYVKRFLPGLYPIARGVELLTGKPFKRFRPHALWYQQPIYYLSNHLNFGASGDAVTWPSYTNALDYELEIGAILAKPLINASPEEVAAAIGGFVVLNDYSARDKQKDEMESGFGPQKAKHFTSTMSSVLVTADEIMPYIDDLKGSVLINGEEVARCHSAGMHYSLFEAIAFASQGEWLHPGELFGSGTLPGGAGMENGHWVKPGDQLSLSIDRIGQLTNTIVKEENR